MGTGFLHWLKLLGYLAANKIQIRKLVVLFISSDYSRDLWNFTTNDIRCLSALSLCQLDQNLFYRMPPQEALSSWMAKIKMSRADRSGRAPTPKRSRLGERVSSLLPASYRVYMYFRLRRVAQESDTAIAQLIRTIGAENIFFIHLPQRDEIVNGPNGLGIETRRAIQQAGGTVLDGFKECRLTIADYYSNDEHPNGSGYAKIASCVRAGMRRFTAGRPVQNPHSSRFEPGYEVGIFR